MTASLPPADTLVSSSSPKTTLSAAPPVMVQLQCYRNDTARSSTAPPCDTDFDSTKADSCSTSLFCIDPTGGRSYQTCSASAGTNVNALCPCVPVFTSPNLLDFGATFTICVDGTYCCGRNNRECCERKQGRLLNISTVSMSGAPPAAAGTSTGPMTVASSVLALETSTTASDATSTVTTTLRTITSRIVTESTTAKEAALSPSIPSVSRSDQTAPPNAPGSQHMDSSSESSSIGGTTTYAGIVAGLAIPLLLVMAACGLLVWKIRRRHDGGGRNGRAGVSLLPWRRRRGTATLSIVEGGRSTRQSARVEQGRKRPTDHRVWI